ncbi:uncharacterized protein LOC127287900 [Leptopilina boulardi]|uniref:uncharacterized protein LOC127287900 n=1 Tax=Leptopilina boulardi TaxID=63433 RepID=UPI0021F56EC8|nr:uncharacterized protein LOC127287900 [Leptopilina boulardi]
MFDEDVLNLKDVLITWGLDEYYDGFCAQKIDLDELSQLHIPEWSGVLENLIPVAGHRIRFVKKITELFAPDNLLKGQSIVQKDYIEIEITKEDISFATHPENTSFTTSAENNSENVANPSAISKKKKCR